MQTKKARAASQQGFTLMELLVVMVILGVLVAMGLASFRSSQTKSRDSQRKSNLRQIALALESYYTDKGIYPPDDGAGGIKGCGANDATLCVPGQKFTDKNGTIYMVLLPADPLAGYAYYYDACCSNKSFQLYGRLENLEDADVKKNGSAYQSYTGTSCGNSKKCNYGIASTNLAPDDNGHTLVDE